MELEITWKRTLRVWWSMTWRGVVATLFVSWLLGQALQVIATVAQISPDDQSSPLPIIAAVATLVAFLAASIVPVKMVLGKKIGNVRLILVPATSPNSGGEPEPVDK